jgi:hypothetical protein
MKTMGSGGGADAGELTECMNEVKNLRSEFDEHRDQAIKNL